MNTAIYIKKYQNDAVIFLTQKQTRNFIVNETNWMRSMNTTTRNNIQTLHKPNMN